MPFDEEKIQAGVRLVLEGIGDDPDREGVKDTPRRVADMYREIFAGIHVDATPIATVVPGADFDEMIMVKDIPLYSVCEHHLLPWVGTAHVAYIPNKDGRITGLSKIARVVDTLSKRLQVQERLTTEIADAIEAALEPRGVFGPFQQDHGEVERGPELAEEPDRLGRSAIVGPLVASEVSERGAEAVGLRSEER